MEHIQAAWPVAVSNSPDAFPKLRCTDRSILMELFSRLKKEIIDEFFTFLANL